MPRVAKPKHVFPPVWGEVEWPKLNVLTFDQTITNTGWALLRFTETAPPSVAMHGTLRTELGKSQGFEDTFARATSLVESFNGVFTAAWSHSPIDLIVHEMPALGGFRTDSSLVSATVLRCAASQHRDVCFVPVVMVQNQQMKKYICGDRNATKAQVRKGVWEVVPEFATNEHVADALALGITHVAKEALTAKSTR